jgi:hypothetical protein
LGFRLGDTNRKQVDEEYDISQREVSFPSVVSVTGRVELYLED